MACWLVGLLAVGITFINCSNSSDDVENMSITVPEDEGSEKPANPED